MKTTLKHIFSYFALFSPIILTSCQSQEVNIESEPMESNIIEITPSQFDLGKMKIGNITNETFQTSIKLTGSIEVPPKNKSSVSAYFGGYIKHISLKEGEKVHKGQTLFTLENPSYIEIQQKYLETKSEIKYLKSDYERQKSLSQNQVNSQKTLLKSESEYKSALSVLKSLEKKLQLMNLNPDKLTEERITSTISVKSPISGYITKVLASSGQFLNPSDVALTIINTDDLHAELTLYEKDLGKVKVGQDVNITVQNTPHKYPAEVFIINKSLNPENRSVTIHCKLKHETDAQSLTPGMYVEAEVISKSDSSLALPKEAIVVVKNKSYVLVEIKSENSILKFKKVEVITGNHSMDFIEIKNHNDFPANSKILTYGSFNLIQE